MTEDNTFITKVGTDENGQLFLLFPADFNEKLQLVENEVLLWEVNEEGTITITKTNYIHNDDNI